MPQQTLLRHRHRGFHRRRGAPPCWPSRLGTLLMASKATRLLELHLMQALLMAMRALLTTMQALLTAPRSRECPRVVKHPDIDCTRCYQSHRPPPHRSHHRRPRRSHRRPLRHPRCRHRCHWPDGDIWRDHKSGQFRSWATDFARIGWRVHPMGLSRGACRSIPLHHRRPRHRRPHPHLLRRHRRPHPHRRHRHRRPHPHRRQRHLYHQARLRGRRRDRRSLQPTPLAFDMTYSQTEVSRLKTARSYSTRCHLPHPLLRNGGICRMHVLDRLRPSQSTATLRCTLMGQSPTYLSSTQTTSPISTARTPDPHHPGTLPSTSTQLWAA